VVPFRIGTERRKRGGRPKSLSLAISKIQAFSAAIET